MRFIHMRLCSQDSMQTCLDLHKSILIQQLILIINYLASPAFGTTQKTKPAVFTAGFLF